MKTTIDQGTYNTWVSMVGRCHDKDHQGFEDYGGRGVFVCSAWINNPRQFFEHMGKRPPHATIERIDNLKGYEPGNCKWVEGARQARNQRTNQMIFYRGQSRCLADWCEQLKLRYGVMRGRIVRKGWPPGEAFTTAYKPRAGVAPDPWELPEYPSNKYFLSRRIAWRRGYQAGVAGKSEDSWIADRVSFPLSKCMDMWKQGRLVGLRIRKQLQGAK